MICATPLFSNLIFHSVYRGYVLTVPKLQSLEYETGQIGVFWDILWHKHFVCKNCETYLTLECTLKSPWPTGFEKSKTDQPSPEKLQFNGSKIEVFLLDFWQYPLKSSWNDSILVPLNSYFSGLGWSILDFSKPVGQRSFRAHYKAK